MERLADYLGVSTGETGDVAAPNTETEATEPQDGNVEQDTGGETGTQEGDAAPAEQQEEVDEQEPAPKQTPEQNAAFAKLRREAEEAKRELQQLDAWVEQNFGQTHNLHTWKQYQEAVQQTRQQSQTQQQQQVFQQQLQNVYTQTRQYWLNLGYDENFAEAQARNEVRIVQAEQRAQEAQNAILQERQYKAQQQQRIAQELAHQQRIKRILDDHAALTAKYGDMVPSMEQLAADPEIIRLMGQGYSLRSAWLEANEDKIAGRASAAAKQRALNQVNSKKHLKPDGESGGELDAVVVPPDVMANFRALNKGVPDEKFIEFYRKTHPPKKRR